MDPRSKPPPDRLDFPWNEALEIVFLETSLENYIDFLRLEYLLFKERLERDPDPYDVSGNRLWPYKFKVEPIAAETFPLPYRFSGIGRDMCDGADHRETNRVFALKDRSDMIVITPRPPIDAPSGMGIFCDPMAVCNFLRCGGLESRSHYCHNERQRRIATSDRLVCYGPDGRILRFMKVEMQSMQSDGRERLQFQQMGRVQPWEDAENLDRRKLRDRLNRKIILDYIDRYLGFSFMSDPVSAISKGVRLIEEHGTPQDTDLRSAADRYYAAREKSTALFLEYSQKNWRD